MSCARPVAAVAQASAASISGWFSRWSARRAASACSAGTVFAESGSSSGRANGGRATTGDSGACSRIRWAFMPLKPKALTPARLLPPCGIQSCSVVLMRTGICAHGMSGVGFLTCRLAGIWRRCSESTSLITLITPEAASRWAMLLLTEPTSNGWLMGRPSPYTAARASTSMGSPSEVPVPWAST